MPPYLHHNTSSVRDPCSKVPPSTRYSRELGVKAAERSDTDGGFYGRGISRSVSSELAEQCRRHGVPLHRRLARSTPVLPPRTPWLGAGRHVPTLTDWKRRDGGSPVAEQTRSGIANWVCKYSQKAAAYRCICTFLSRRLPPPPRCDYI